MPRPGPRPYECIRRAWHSDSHQPLRGALIQEIFRVVNELHSTSTRRKKEWQEKLPIVVLRAEEILYSKANSESEYAGVETLRARLDDAVNTMIRREDTEEEGVYLAPCVEAALSLGCTPKKIPRGQRQGVSRLLPNGARRGSPACANDGGYRAMAGKGRSEMRNVLGEQNSQVPDQGLNTALPMATSTLYSSVGPPPGPPIACYTPGPGLIFPQAFALSTSFEAAHPVITPSFPQLGGLVQFLKGTDLGTHAGLPRMVPFQQMQRNCSNDPRVLQYVDSLSCSGSTRMDAQFVCKDLNASLCSTSTVSSPSTSISRSSLESGRDSCTESESLVKSALGGASATYTDTQTSLISSDSRITTQMQDIATSPDIFSMNTRLNPQIQGFPTAPDRWHTCPVPRYRASPSSPSSYRASPLQKSSLTSLSSIKADASSHVCIDDLQLRLGPPGKEANSTSVPSGDTSTLKRSRVDTGKLDVSASSGQFQLCGSPLSHQLTWSRG